jgi:hypothetical protein
VPPVLFSTHLEPNLVILRGHGFNSSAAPPGDPVWNAWHSHLQGWAYEILNQSIPASRHSRLLHCSSRIEIPLPGIKALSYAGLLTAPPAWIATGFRLDAIASRASRTPAQPLRPFPPPQRCIRGRGSPHHATHRPLAARDIARMKDAPCSRDRALLHPGNRNHPRPLPCLCSANLSAPNCSAILSALLPMKRRTDAADPRGRTPPARPQPARTQTDHDGPGGRSLGAHVAPDPAGPGRRSYAKATADVVQCLDGSWRVSIRDRLVATTPAAADPGQLRARRRR